MTLHKRVTITDVAVAAGVSVSTVSLVLSGKGRISAATGDRVNAAIERLGFVRNRQAAALRGGQSGTIGLIVRDPGAPFYAGLLAGLIEELERQGRMVLLAPGGRDGHSLVRSAESLLEQGVDGIVIAGYPNSDGTLRERANRAGIPLVYADRASHPDTPDMVSPDNMQAARLLTEHLIGKGHQRIAWLGGRSDSLTRAELLGGFCATLLRYGLPFHSDQVMECESGLQPASDALVTLLRRSAGITAVVCHDVRVATGAWFGLQRVGKSSGVGGLESYYESHIELAAFAYVPEESLEALPVTWVTTPACEIGRAAAWWIVQMGSGAGSDVLGHMEIPGRLAMAVI
ncbi:Mal regulon transcriptional regulator MalI [Jejubacter calystegiae]|uniref:Mal regulon transcriptional regulator MalI n=1 Tax=Jejubacter calystegiae TaxID=2579935 RepID=A0A4P8YK68_9ENTR|nr:Mal regulon transcriptional regulator MalI [Jejubacter calystegiae]QCT21155.1 Mal regulon transcriptional regulator MalI [Jejubacter calystegiae]